MHLALKEVRSFYGAHRAVGFITAVPLQRRCTRAFVFAQRCRERPVGMNPTARCRATVFSDFGLAGFTREYILCIVKLRRRSWSCARRSIRSRRFASTW